MAYSDYYSSLYSANGKDSASNSVAYPESHEEAMEHLDSLSCDSDEFSELTITVRDGDGALKRLLTDIKDLSGIGHGFDVVIDPDMEEFRKFVYIDGDGGFMIKDIKEHKASDKRPKVPLSKK